MPYEPTNWQNGNIITAEKLNNIEEGVDRLFIINVVDSERSFALDKTFEEAYNAALSGKIPVVHYIGNGEVSTRPMRFCNSERMDFQPNLSSTKTGLIISYYRYTSNGDFYMTADTYPQS